MAKRRVSSWGVLVALGCSAPAWAGTVAPVDPAAYPWTGTVRVTTNIGSSCTGALVGRSTVVTAAHCLYNKRTQAMLRAVSLHVLFGYDKGELTMHSKVTAVTLGGPWRPDGGGVEAVARDWAVLTLETPAPASAAILPLAAEVARDTPAWLAGFRQSKAHILTGDTGCRIQHVQPAAPGAVLVHDCASEKGVSGAPLLVKQGERWAVAGVLVGSLTSQPGRAVAASAAGFATALKP